MLIYLWDTYNWSFPPTSLPMQGSLAITGVEEFDYRCPFVMTQLVNIISHHRKRSLLKEGHNDWYSCFKSMERVMILIHWKPSFDVLVLSSVLVTALFFCLLLRTWAMPTWAMPLTLSLFLSRYVSNQTGIIVLM